MLAVQDLSVGFSPIIFLLVFLCLLESYATRAHLYRLLRERHPAIYDLLGQPRLFWNDTVKNWFAVQGLLFSGRFRETHDAEVIRLCRFIRALKRLFGILRGLRGRGLYPFRA